MIDKVSVIIPTHKRPHFLNRAVDSVLAQTYNNVEIVVVDDNAPDSDDRRHTARAMRRYKSSKKVVYILNDGPHGGGPARNRGIEAATGTYVTFLDDDDIYLPEKVEVQLRFMVENSLEMSFTDVFLHDNNDKLFEYRRHTYVTDCSNEELMRQHILHSLGPTSTFMVKRASLSAVGGFADVPMGQDFMLMWRMIEFDTNIGYLPVSYIIQYLHDGERISVGPNKINGEKRLYALKKTRRHMLDYDEQKYLDFRHYAVLSITSKRSKKPFDYIKYGIKAIWISPAFFIKEAKILFIGRFKANHGKVAQPLLEEGVMFTGQPANGLVANTSLSLR
ncbi:MAG: glycosyltransferase [Oscillospiraceae bacterium]|nr:glycosyltransferase [Oscillospiraceae bacterium]